MQRDVQKVCHAAWWGDIGYGVNVGSGVNVGYKVKVG